jgi:hypothetical protein
MLSQLLFELHSSCETGEVASKDEDRFHGYVVLFVETKVGAEVFLKVDGQQAGH